MTQFVTGQPKVMYATDKPKGFKVKKRRQSLRINKGNS